MSDVYVYVMPPPCAVLGDLRTVAVHDSVNLDFDRDDGELVGVEVLGAVHVEIDGLDPSDQAAEIERLREALRAMARRSNANRTRYYDVAQALGCGRGGTHEWICGVAKRSGDLWSAAMEHFMQPLRAPHREGDAF